MKIETIDFEIKGDERGSLIAIEDKKDIPFDIKRVYYIYNTKKNTSRGFHAHKKLRQVAICLKGSCKFVLDDGNEKNSIILNDPSIGLVINEMVWREMYDFSKDCVLMVLASDYYDESDYIRDHEEFLKLGEKT